MPLRAHTADAEFQAVRPGQSDGSVWRIELSGVVTHATEAGRPSFSLLRRPPRHRETESALIPGVLSDASGLLCIKDERPPSRRRNTSGFAGKIRLDIELADSDLTLSDTERQRITRLLLTAGSLWTQACVDCKVEQLAVITVDGTLFVRSSFAAWYQKEIAVAPRSPSERTLASLESSLTDALEPSQWLLAGESLPPAPRSKTFSDYVSFPISAATPICTRADVNTILCRSYGLRQQSQHHWLPI